MGFFSELISGVAKVVISPAAIVKDVIDVTRGDEPTTTGKVLRSANKDLNKAVDDLADGKL